MQYCIDCHVSGVAACFLVVAALLEGIVDALRHAVCMLREAADAGTGYIGAFPQSVGLFRGYSALIGEGFGAFLRVAGCIRPANACVNMACATAMGLRSATMTHCCAATRRSATAARRSTTAAPPSTTAARWSMTTARQSWTTVFRNWQLHLIATQSDHI